MHRFRSTEDRTAPTLGRYAEADCLDSLTEEPLPLYSDALDIAVLWNAKAGCTFAIKWLYYQEGLLDEALAYSTWPHEYRQQVYCRRPAYSEKVRRIPSLGPRALKFVRNPFDRAVGAYLSYCQQAFRPIDPAHAPMLAAISGHIGRPVGPDQFFTFREFVSFLGTLDLDSADVHIRRQISACERLAQLPELTVVRIEETSRELPRIEDGLGLPHSDLGRLRRSVHHTRREHVNSFVGDKRFGQTISVSVPTSRSFYDDKLVEAVAKQYSIDLTTYRYTFDSEESGPELLALA